MTPRTIGPYRVVDVLGEGGMGVVYRAVREGANKPAALKVLRTGLGTAAMRARFERECRIVIEHPNVVRVLDAGHDAEGTPYLAMELLEGATLAARLLQVGPQATLSPAEVVEIGVQVCAGLAAAHGRGIVHRDLKPSNVFLCEDGHIKLLDFGIALLLDRDTRLTQTGAVPGTVGYLSPEQAEGRPVDARSDLWALGSILWEALTGAPPFQRESPLATVIATLMAELPSLPEIRPGIPPALVAVLERTLAREPARRPASAEVLGRALSTLDMSPPTSEPARRGSMRPGEKRVVAVVLAEEVRDGDRVSSIVADAGGAPLLLAGRRAVGLFGGETWVGDEVERAARAALALRPVCSRVAVASGWATGSADSIGGEALLAAERACAAGLAGVAVDAEAARALRDHMTLVPVAHGMFGLEAATRDETLETIASRERALYGREVEIAQLRSTLRTSLEGQAVALVVIGAVGTGKSRLVHSLTKMAAEAGVRVARATALSAMRPVALSLVRALLGDEGGPSSTEGDIALLSDRARAEAVAALDALVEPGPLAVILDDIQWADDASLELLEEWLERHEDHPLVLFATGRPELIDERPRPLGDVHTTVLRLRGLLRQDVAALARDVAGFELPQATTRAIAERTDGNPFFVVQTVRALMEEERPPSELAKLPLPVTVEAAIQSRFDHLPDDERELCRRVAIWNRPFTRAEARALSSSQPHLDVPRLLERLVDKELLSARGRRERRRFQHRSSLVQEVAQHSLTEVEARGLHLHAADQLEPLGDAGALERAAHLDAAGEQRAAGEWARAARVQINRGDAPLALRCADRATAAGFCDFELAALRVDALRFLARTDEQGDALESALSLANDDLSRSRILSERAVWLWRSGDRSQAAEAARSAVAAARASADEGAQVLALGRLFLVLNQTEAAPEAVAALTEAVRRSALCDRHVRARALAWRAYHVATTGDLGARLEAYGELAESYEELGDRRRAAGANANLADAYNRLGAYEEAAVALRAALEDCRSIGHRTMEGYTLLNLGYALTGGGAHQDALDALDGAAAIADAAGERRLGLLVALYRARAHLGAGHLTQASQVGSLLDECKSDAPDVYVGSLAVRAMAALSMDKLSDALQLSSQAREMLSEIGRIEEDEADVFVVRAEALRRAGREDEARVVRAEGARRVAAIAAGITDEELRRGFVSMSAHQSLLGPDST